MSLSRASLLALFALVAAAVAACASPGPAPASAPPAQSLAGQTITVYSGRAEDLVGPIIEQFTRDTGVKANVRYGGTAELAAAILEEGKNSPADVYWAQDAGALGALSRSGVFAKLPDNIVTRVDQRFRSPKGEWVGITGRARAVAYNTRKLAEKDLPDSTFGFTDPKWKGRIGWAPTNGSFQAFVTAMRIVEGEAKTRQWLEGIKANNPKAYRNNTAVLLAVASGEVDAGFVNHYYLYAQLKEKGPSFPARNYYPRAGDVGGMVNVAGAGVLATSKNKDAALKFVDYMLSSGAQTYFAGDAPGGDAYEYPLISGVPIHVELTPLSQVKTPNVDLGSLSDLEGTLKLLRDVGIL